MSDEETEMDPAGDEADTVTRYFNAQPSGNGGGAFAISMCKMAEMIRLRL